MDWIEKIDWDSLLFPNDTFTPFVPQDAGDPHDPFYTKVAKLQTLLRKRPLWLSDEYRTPQGINAILYSYFSGHNISDNRFGGIITLYTFSHKKFRISNI